MGMHADSTARVFSHDLEPQPARTVRCPGCIGLADVQSRYVLIDAAGVRIYCSAACKERALADEPPPAEPETLRRPPSPFIVGGLVVGCLFVTDTRATELPEPTPVPFVFVPPVLLVPAPPPEPSPEELLRRQWMTELIKDAWVHPLNGPRRRMPIRDSRVFGAERPGDRPIECQNGHCGVDIGGEVWGEPVLAAHDGVVDRVQRGPNEHRGGLYVRLAHRDGTVFSQYFHLAAIPRWIEVGRAVEAGEVIGLVGDSGVHSSGPHLHFTLSIRPSPDQPERYIDPEPLIALWPVHIPDPAGTSGRLSAASEAPGAVRGAVNRRRRVAQRAPAAAPPAEEVAPSDAPSSMSGTE